MLRRTLFMALAIMSGAVTFVDDLGGAVVLAANKQSVVDAYEQAGVDVGNCGNRPVGVNDPSGGMSGCLDGAFKDIARRIEGASGDAASGDADSVGEPDIK